MGAQGEDEKDWRLQVEPDGRAAEQGGSSHLFGRVRARDLPAQAESQVGDDVVVTHDGARLFAYAASRDALARARTAIERVLEQDGLTATVLTSHWDEHEDRWEQIDPPLDSSGQAAEHAADEIADRMETRTLALAAGKLVRETLEVSMQEAAARLELQCVIVEHPHLLRTQVAFTVTGRHGQIDRFAEELRAEGLQTVRAEMALQSSGL